MKNFKQISVSLLALISWQYAHAQEIKLKVQSGEESLPYSFVYINGEAFAATDAEGLLFIPQEKLNVGDTLSASYVGFEGGRIIYDGNPEGERVIDLKSLYKLDEVIVSGKRVNMYKLLRKHMDIPGFNFDNKFSLSFTSSFNDGERDHDSSGEIEMVFSPRIVDIDFRYKCLGIEAAGDTTKIVSNIGSSLGHTIRYSFGLTRPDMYKNAHITSRAIENDERIFILSYTYGISSSQLILYVDVGSKQLKRMEVSYLGSLSSMYLATSYGAGKNGEIFITDYEYKSYSRGETLQVKGSNIKASPMKESLMYMFYDKGDMSKPI